jgi:LPS-assembly protein
MMPGVIIGSKATVDPSDASIDRAAIAASVSNGPWSFAADYSYLAADPALGLLTDQHDLGGSVRVPLHEYWYAQAAAGWDVTTNNLINHSATVGYDDGYLAVAGHYSATGDDPFNPASQSYKLSFKLKGPDGSGYSF